MSFIGLRDRRKNGQRLAREMHSYRAYAIICGTAMPILSIRHVTTYHYHQPVAFGAHRMMLRPRDDDDQKVIESEIEITPRPRQLAWTRDAFGNHVAIAEFADRAAELRFVSNIRLDHAPAGFRAADIEDFARTYPFAYAAEDWPALKRLRPAAILACRTRSLERGLLPQRRFRRHARAARRHDADHPANFQARRAAREGDPESGTDPRSRERQLPRPRDADDRGAALTRHRRAVRFRISAFAR